jgi:hypothetical protein
MPENSISIATHDKALSFSFRDTDANKAVRIGTVAIIILEVVEDNDFDPILKAIM